MRQIIRDVIEGELTLEYFAKKFSEGWRVASIDWVRGTGGLEVSDTSGDVLPEPALPYGFRMATAGLIEESPLETAVLLLVLEQIIREKRIQEIAAELNAQGYVTRTGSAWSATEVFNLLPRVIETGPAILKSHAWQQRRQALDRKPTSTQ